MLKLYFAPGTCSLSPHVVLLEAGVPHEIERVDHRAKKMKDGSDFLAVNPKGYVPALRLDDGEVLTEGAVMVQFIADLAPEQKLAPPYGTRERYRLMSWLNYVASEVHKSFSPLFNALLPEPQKELFRTILRKKLAFLDGELRQRDYLMGESFSVVDAYLFTVLGWTRRVGIALADESPALARYVERVGARPSVAQALAAEAAAK